MMTSKVLATLESRGLLARATDATDARIRRITPTLTARDVLREATRIARALDADLIGTDPALRDRLATIAGTTAKA